MNGASLLRLVALGAIWGGSFAFMRIASPQFGAPALIGLRVAIAALFLASIAMLRSTPLAWRAHWRRYLVIGTTNSAIPFVLFAHAAQTLPAAVLALTNSLAPIFGALLAAAWLGIAITPRTWLGLGAGVAGVAVLSASSLAGSAIAAPREAIALALFEAIAAPFFYGLAATYIRRQSAGMDAFGNAHGSMWAATLCMAPLAFAYMPHAAPTPPAWIAALALGLLCTGIAYLLQFRLIADLGATRALTVTFLIPLFGVLWSALLLREPVGLPLLAAGTLIVAGMYLTVTPSPARR